MNWNMLPSKSGGATSTFDEAEDVLAFGIKNKWERIILVTDSYHTGRALLAFEKVFKGQEVKLQITGATNEIFNERNWWKTDSAFWPIFRKPLNIQFTGYGIMSQKSYGTINTFLNFFRYYKRRAVISVSRAFVMISSFTDSVLCQTPTRDRRHIPSPSLESVFLEVFLHPLKISHRPFYYQPCFFC